MKKEEKVFDVIVYGLMVIPTIADNEQEAELLVREQMDADNDGLINGEVRMTGYALAIDPDQEFVVEQVEEDFICDDCLEHSEEGIKH